VQSRRHGFAAYSRDNNNVQFTTFAHDGRLTDLISTPARVVTSGYDGALMSWDRDNGRLFDVKMRQPTAILDIDASPTEPMHVATAGVDGTVHIWNVEDGSSAEIIQAGHGAAWFVRFDKSGQKLVSVHRDGSVILTALKPNAQNDTTIWKSANHTLHRAEFSSAGTKILMLEGEKYEQEGSQLRANDQSDQPYLVKIYKVQPLDNKPIAELSHDSPVRFARFDTKAERVVTVTKSGEINLWQVSPVEKLHRIGKAEQSNHYQPYSPLLENIYVEFSPDGDLLYAEFSDASGVSDYAMLFRTSDGQAVLEFPTMASTRARMTYPWLDISPAFTPDGKWLLRGLGPRRIFGEDFQRLLETSARPIDLGTDIQPRELTTEELNAFGISAQPN
jgi:WD40 repeat protein